MGVYCIVCVGVCVCVWGGRTYSCMFGVGVV